MLELEDPDSDPEEGLPLLPPPEILAAHPGLARLLRGVGSALGAGGVAPTLAAQLRQAEAELRRRRGAFLRVETLWRGLQELCRDPHGLPPAVLGELEQALALGELRQTEGAGTAMRPPPQDPSSLLPRLLPPLERLLLRKADDLADYHAGGTPRNPPETSRKPPGTPQNPGETPQKLRGEEQRLQRAQRRRRRLLRLLETQRRAYPEVLGRCGALLGRLQEKKREGEELERRKAKYLEVKGGAVLLKIRLEELTLLVDTYPPEKVEAHRRIRSLLEAESRRLSGEARGAESALSSFAALGPDFAAMAAEYGRLRQRLRQRRWALRELRPTGDAPHGDAPAPRDADGQ